MYKFAVVSDIHLGHRRNSTESIIAMLDAAFPHNAETAELDILFIAGDLFDKLVDFPDDSLMSIQLWMARVLRMCEEFKIKIRILEGTASHDRRQSVLFLWVAKTLKLDVDIQYVPTLHVEYMEEHDINVLYMPDDLNQNRTEETLEQVKELLASKGLQSADLGIFHGCFEFQLPPAARKNAPFHDSSEYLQLVRGLIFIGHHHTFNTYERIYAQGSLDRLTHNEEEPKGHCRAAVYDDGHYEVEFRENKLARRYETLRMATSNGVLSLEEAIEAADALAKKLPEDSCIRIQGPKNHPALADISVFVRMHPTMVWSRDVKDPETDKVEAEILEVEDLHYTPIHIDKHNVEALLMERINTNYAADPALIAAAQANLRGVI